MIYLIKLDVVANVVATNVIVYFYRITMSIQRNSRLDRFSIFVIGEQRNPYNGTTAIRYLPTSWIAASWKGGISTYHIL
jgi:hypothetical protein